MSPKQDEEFDVKASTLDDQDVISTRSNGRRLFLASLGITVVGATAIAIGLNHSSARASDNDGKDSKHHDFPKGKSDSDTTRNADLKTADSDERNSKARDNDQSRLRDAKRSSDSD